MRTLKGRNESHPISGTCSFSCSIDTTLTKYTYTMLQKECKRVCRKDIYRRDEECIPLGQGVLQILMVCKLS